MRLVVEFACLFACLFVSVFLCLVVEFACLYLCLVSGLDGVVPGTWGYKMVACQVQQDEALVCCFAV